MIRFNLIGSWSRQRQSSEMPMNRFISFLVAVLVCALWGGAARAQMSQADLLTRIDRLEGALRELTGTVEQLQYRNQQLEQQLRALQDASQTGARPPVSPQPQPPLRPTGQYTPPPAAPAPAPVIAAAPPPAPIEAEPPPQPPGRGGRGDAFNPALNPAAPGAPRPLGTSTAATEPPPPVADVPPAGPRQPGAPLDLSSTSVPPPPPSGAAPGVPCRRHRRAIKERHRRHAGDLAAGQSCPRTSA